VTIAGARAAIGRTLHDPAQVLAMILLGALALRVIWLWLPQGSLIFDESYYVNAARVILGWEVPAGAHYEGSLAGFDPNEEHPPLGKAIIALSMLVFGDNGVGYRIPSVLAGMVSLAAVYGIVRAAGQTQRLGLLAVALLALDNLTFVHARIGTLDMLALAPVLVGAWLGLRGHWGWAGLALAIGSMVKLTGAFALVGLLLFQAVELVRRWKTERRLGFDDLRPTILLGAVYLAVGLTGLWLLDLRFSPYPDPLSHLAHMAAFGSALRAPDGLTGIASYPWQWLINEGHIDYLRVVVSTTVEGQPAGSHVSINFRGAINPVLLGAAPLGLLFSGWLAWRRADRAATWAVTWAAATYLPYVALAIVAQRITYLYYMVPAMPALAVAVALLLARSGLPRFVTWGFLALMVVGYLALFPFRQLP
jgi:4-amino-4-deoxy-L-arabinose transferase-like glycosyltransferase